VDTDDHQSVRVLAVGVPLAWFLSSRAGMGARGVFVALAVAYSTLALVSVIIFRRGRWKTKRV
jgi:Na+-driven multidrug efflux pump